MVAKNKQNDKPTLTDETMMALAGFDQRDAHNGNDMSFQTCDQLAPGLDSPFYTCLVRSGTTIHHPREFTFNTAYAGDIISSSAFVQIIVLLYMPNNIWTYNANAMFICCVPLQKMAK
ncbi:hypothetical protein PVAP13_9KG230327 [Panicum virgatum]|uniref:Uncharacterized protein n=1 Tax=Panicum virgatum TaxID=38727 RepID=A0A8T0N970_PANVG|nr:hypothetical protein PVAP13_9KG230327 [Panicum virgatum]